MAYGDRRIVYILRSSTHPERHYVGITADLVSRLHWHNGGPCGYTLQNRPGKSSSAGTFRMSRPQFVSSDI